MNKGINNSIAAYAAKRIFLPEPHPSSPGCMWRLVCSLLATTTSGLLCLNRCKSTPPQLHVQFLLMDKEKVVQFHRNHEFKIKAKRKRIEHEKLNAVYLQYQKDVTRNTMYKSQTGCDDTPTTKKTKKSACLHSKFGCEGKNGHNTERSKHYDYHASKLGGISLAGAKQGWIEQNEIGTYKKTFFFS